MPCYTALEKKNLSVSPEDNVEFALKIIQKEKVSTLAVIDDDGVFLGIFSKKILLSNLIPVSVVADSTSGFQMDVKVPAAPGISKRLQNIKYSKVSDVMNRKPVCIAPDAPIWEGVGILSRHGAPLSVVDNKNKFYGFITYDSLLGDLENMETTDS